MELSPCEALYILQNQIKKDGVQFIPHRFFHRYAQGDFKNETILEFYKIVSEANIDRIYFCKIDKLKR